VLRFQYKTDNVFNEVLERALGETIDSIKESLRYESDGDDRFDLIQHIWEDDIKRAFGTPEFLLHVLEALLEAHQSKDLYMPTDWHFLLLDRILHSWCDCYGDMAGEADNDFLLRDDDGDPIMEVKFRDVVETFFWDTDYDFPADLAAQLRGTVVQEQSDVSDVALNASMRKSVDLEDVNLVPWRDGDDRGEAGCWWKEELEEA